MVDAIPQLKRKIEEVAAQRKSKKQRKNESATGNEAEATAPSTPKKSPAAAPKAQSKTSTKNTKAKGASETAAASQGQANGVADVDTQKDSIDVSSKPTQKRRKKEKKGGAAANDETEVAEDDTAQITAIVPLTQAQVEKALKKQEQDERKAADLSIAKTKKQKSKGSSKWVSSPAQGGWFLPADPIFSADEKYLILANLKSLQVYVTETSLLANALPIGGTGVLTAHALSSTNPSQVYVADSNGLITLWDWVNGAKVGRWEIGALVRNMTVITQPESNEDLVYCHETGSNHVINVHALRTKSQVSKTELKRVLKTSSAVRGIQVLLQGKYVILATADSIMVGKRMKLNKTALQDFEYVWREFKFSKRITTFNAYHREPEESSKGKKASSEQRDAIDIAVGEETGVVFLFEDILATFAAIEGSQKGKKEKTDNAESLRPKRFHWHRDAVGAVKWSLDGNYFISGGDETVLTIWQLATGKPQHLPHLTAAIENIVVSPSGSSYALSLANNSVIVLSTTELEAKTNIVGIQSRRVDLEQLPKDSKSGKAYLDIFHSVPLAVNPANSTEVLISVPSSQPRHRNEGLRPEPYLQTFDLANHRAKSRQALTRNNATEPSVAPEGGRIIEPSVKHLQLSHDGEWLATVDEWVPPRSDTGFLNEGIPQFNEEERLNRREVYLKIWRRDEHHAQWKLEARIDSPHFFENVCGNGRVFDLVADPCTTGFATIGEDHIVRIWRPKTRLRDGVVVRGAEGEGLVTWSLDRSIEISDKLDVLEASQQSLPPRTSRLAFSADGSALATAVSWASDSDLGVTHIIDTQTAAIRRSITEIDVTALSGLAFVGHHLVMVADSITVWDMVLDQLAYSVPMNTAGIDRIERIPLVRLAVNETDATFAVSVPQFDKNELSGSRLMKASSKISIFDPNHNEALYTSASASLSLALASRKGERGFITLDSTSCIKTINPTTSVLQLPSPPPEEKTELQRSAYGVEEDEDETLGTRIVAIAISEDLTQNLADDQMVFSAQKLQEVLDNGSVPPPPQGLFSAVLALVSRPVKVAA